MNASTLTLCRPIWFHFSKFLFFLVLTGSLFLFGRTSENRVITDPEPKSDSALKSPDGMFYIADVNMIYSGQAADKTLKIQQENKISLSAEMKAQIKQQGEQQYLPILRAECRARYPALFSETANGAFPLLIEIEVFNYTTSPIKTSGSLYASVIEYDYDEDYYVKVSIWTGSKDLQGAIIQAKAHLKYHEKIQPQITRKKDKKGTIQVKVDEILLDTLKTKASHNAPVIAKLVAAQEPMFWTSQPHDVVFSESPSKPTAGAPEKAPLPSVIPAPY
jgi:hypothetical protein